MSQTDHITPSELRARAEAIWRAGVAAVDSFKLVSEQVRVDGNTLRVGDSEIDLRAVNRIAVVGAGKAGAGMAAGFENAASELLDRTEGWVNVPEDCVRDLKRIHLHSARPAGLNEPTAAGVEGTRRILNLVGSLTADDVCVVLLSGGGSALLPAPVDSISLEEKQIVTRLLMHGGSSIEELNLVRTHLSSVKGGGLVRACRAGRVISLIISDVIGDPLGTIASGPTVPNGEPAARALEILSRYGGQVPETVLEILQARQTESVPVENSDHVHNHIIGNNQTAVLAAANAARQLGYDVQIGGSDNTGIAFEVGEKLAREAESIRQSGHGKSHCFISGGEPTVKLAPTDEPRRGGRNQEVVLGALATGIDFCGITVLSGGTDGEDGPTDTAGAIATEDTVNRMQSRSLDPKAFLAINNSYEFFHQTGSLLVTGPTHTNVMDLRVVLVHSS